MNVKLSIISVLSNQDSSFASENFFTFIVFNSPAILEVEDSFLEVTSGSIFLQSPECSFVLKEKPSSTLNYSLVTFKGSDASRIVKVSNITCNSLLTPLHTHFIDSIFSKLSLELKTQGDNWKSVCLAYLLELLAKTHRLSNYDFTETLPDHSQNLRDLRAEIHENYSKNWKIDDMAAKMDLSTSRFASLYKQTFKISPTEDLIQTRIDQAKKMLSGSKVSVKKVSEACGFESVHYFHRAFKKRSNITPKHFQNAQFAQEGSVFTNERHFSLDKLTQQAEYSGIIELIDGQLHFHGNTSHVSELLGYSTSQLKDLPFLTFVDQKDISIANEAVNKILKNKNIIDLSLNLVHESGSIVPIQFSALLKGKNWYWFIKHSSVLA